ncbi:MAG: hypothetical protein ACREEE_17840 [Dongiaceae bacterium]
METILGMNLARRLWAGEVALPVAFWGYMVAGGIILNLVTAAIGLALFAAEAPTAIAIATLFLHAPYNLFMLVAVWRGAGRWRSAARWAALARPAAVAWTVLALVI